MEKKEVALLAGGSGIAPVFQVIRFALENGKDETRLYLIYANKTEGDILLRTGNVVIFAAVAFLH